MEVFDTGPKISDAKGSLKSSEICGCLSRIRVLDRALNNVQCGRHEFPEGDLPPMLTDSLDLSVSHYFLWRIFCHLLTFLTIPVYPEVPSDLSSDKSGAVASSKIAS